MDACHESFKDTNQSLLNFLLPPRRIIHAFRLEVHYRPTDIIVRIVPLEFVNIWYTFLFQQAVNDSKVFNTCHSVVSCKFLFDF
jgi:hypothetical protein